MRRALTIVLCAFFAIIAASCTTDQPTRPPTAEQMLENQRLKGCVPFPTALLTVGTPPMQIQARPYILVSPMCGTGDGFAHLPAPPSIAAEPGAVLQLATAPAATKGIKTIIYSTEGVVWGYSLGTGQSQPKPFRQTELLTTELAVPADLVPAEYLVTTYFEFDETRSGLRAVWFSFRLQVKPPA